MRRVPPSSGPTRPALVLLAGAADTAPALHAEMVALPMEFGTAHNLLTRGCVGPETRIAVICAEDSLSYACLRLARHRGAEVVALCGRQMTARARAAGAEPIPATATLPAHAFDAVVDLTGGAWQKQLSALRPGGLYVTRGAVVGAGRSTAYLNDLPLFEQVHTPREVFSGLITTIEAPHPDAACVSRLSLRSTTHV